MQNTNYSKNDSIVKIRLLLQYNKSQCSLKSYWCQYAFYLLVILQWGYFYYPLFTHKETEAQSLWLAWENHLFGNCIQLVSCDCSPSRLRSRPSFWNHHTETRGLWTQKKEDLLASLTILGQIAVVSKAQGVGAQWQRKWPYLNPSHGLRRRKDILGLKLKPSESQRCSLACTPVNTLFCLGGRVG